MLWRQASLPDGEGGISAARRIIDRGNPCKISKAPSLPKIIPPGWEARRYDCPLKVSSAVKTVLPATRALACA